MSRKRALIIGINQYHPVIGALAGCVNDADKIKKLLKESYHFPTQEIRELIDEDATRAAILAGLAWLLEGVQTGDTLVFFYSGHGTRLDNSTDPSGKDEVLVAFSPEWETLLARERNPFVLFRKENWDLQFIRDKELKALFDSMPPGVNLTLIVDCCHSGDVNRDIKSFPRYIEPPPYIQGAIIEAQQTYWATLQANNPPATLDEYKLNSQQLKNLFQKVFRGNRFDFVNTSEKSILLAACSERETALEKMIDGKRGGVFTYHLVNVLSSQDQVPTYAELIQALGEKMRFTSQMPRLACPEQYLQHKVFDSNIG